MNTAPSEPDLTFQWPVEKGFPWVLFVCIAGSMLAHVLTFFLFHVVYPQHVTIHRSPPIVSLLTPSSPQNIALLRWVEAEDPALIAGDNSVVPPDLATVKYQPSFAAPRTAPLGPPEEKPEEVRFPPAVDHLTPERPAAASPAAQPAPARARTAIRFTTPLAARPLRENPPLETSRQSAAPIEPTVVLIGVDPAGRVQYAFLQQTSGDPAFDDLAIEHLQRLAFAPAAEPVLWGHVTFAWGADAYQLLK